MDEERHEACLAGYTIIPEFECLACRRVLHLQICSVGNHAELVQGHVIIGLGGPSNRLSIDRLARADCTRGGARHFERHRFAVCDYVDGFQAIVPSIKLDRIRHAPARQPIDWKIARPFLIGSVIAVPIGSRLYVELPEKIIASAISIIMLIAIWLPEISWRPKLRYPWSIVGFIHSFFSTLFAYGALLHAVILHTGLRRRQIVGTMAACLTAMQILKIAGYALNGFDYAPYVQIIVISILAAFLGTWVGKMVVDRISEELFRIVFRALVTVTAIRLLYVALVS